MVLDSFFDTIFGWTFQFGPAYSILIISFILTLISTLSYKFLTDQKMMKQLKEESKEIQQKMKEFKGNPDKVMEIQKEQWEKTMKQMKQSIKPMLFTFVPFLIVFIWLRSRFEDTAVGFLGIIDSWFWTYLILSLIFSLVLRKVMKVH